MIEKSILIFYSFLVISIFSLNFHEKWTNRVYEKLKNQNSTWFWFEKFKIKKTKDNYIKFLKGLSKIVIFIMIVNIFTVLLRK